MATRRFVSVSFPEIVKRPLSQIVEISTFPLSCWLNLCSACCLYKPPLLAQKTSPRKHTLIFRNISHARCLPKHGQSYLFQRMWDTHYAHRTTPSTRKWNCVRRSTAKAKKMRSCELRPQWKLPNLSSCASIATYHWLFRLIFPNTEEKRSITILVVSASASVNTETCWAYGPFCPNSSTASKLS